MKYLDSTILSDLKSGLNHGIMVSNLTYQIAKEMKLDEDMCYEMAVAGLVHDIGKLKLSPYLYGRNEGSLAVEEMKYMRMHSKISYDIIQHYDFTYLTLETVLHHHECYDGSGYPDNLKGEDIPIGARVLKVADTFAALISDRPYRKAFSHEAAMEIMIDEVKNFDMEVFIAFQRVIHEEKTIQIIENSNLVFDGIENLICMNATGGNETWQNQ
ncbi:MAG: HD domain-containing protein [Thermoflexaceae bacterium]|nr:HD domain-containing protein [Thermoflexaceae bacterium]